MNNNLAELIPEDSLNWMTGFFVDVRLRKAKLLLLKLRLKKVQSLKMFMCLVFKNVLKKQVVTSAEIEEVVDEFITDPTKFKKFDAIKFFRKQGVNQAHARHIRAFYEGTLAEYQMLQQPAREQEEDLCEGYAHLSKSDVKKGVELFNSIVGACDLITAESKATRKTRTPKPKSADKLVAKMKYCKTDEKYKVASINLRYY